MNELTIKNLHVSVHDKEILTGVNLVIRSGEMHAIMGPNGTGKSTLSAAIMGDPNYQITAGKIEIDGEDVTELSVDERARSGLFQAMQYPSVVPGVTNFEFMKAAVNARRPDKPVSSLQFMKQFEEKRAFLAMKEEVGHRYLNEGFSGGEKKRNEILQMLLIQPNLAILDEIDSGLDIDALKVVAKGVNSMRSAHFSTLMITHYQRLLDYIVPDQVHVMMGGQIVKSAGPDLAKRLEKEGYAGLRDELGLDLSLTDEEEDWA
ncbi:Fe-S cluster assembly ATPase SufC [Fructobacillus sp. M1-13]|uniref:Fe-S cluster assembly ATPase SufC n=1 Tax=Fructobacillus papyriferae TaxID=2713171 RepID=A0ABS5QSX9_9LACO|nr:Fe-S cluster assembly ATPase SufC [Fructobacillus papyriferae]MBS9335067.1 Fe-S cluster assembly ATPase SufC [Fructobacillus papyriferae]MCD2159447.1 Fe-S cluster assembly ATPase SufC [Fructobacillus papyriferae]